MRNIVDGRAFARTSINNQHATPPGLGKGWKIRASFGKANGTFTRYSIAWCPLSASSVHRDKVLEAGEYAMRIGETRFREDGFETRRADRAGFWSAVNNQSAQDLTEVPELTASRPRGQTAPSKTAHYISYPRSSRVGHRALPRMLRRWWSWWLKIRATVCKSRSSSPQLTYLRQTTG